MDKLRNNELEKNIENNLDNVSIGEDETEDINSTLERLLDIYNLVTTGQGFVKKDIVEEYGVSDRTVTRDIRALNSYFEKKSREDDINQVRKITYSRKLGKHRINFKESYAFTESDIYTLIKIVIESRSLNRNEMKRILDILRLQVNEKSEINKVINSEELYYIQPKHNKELIEIIWNLRCCIERKLELRIWYQRADGIIKEHLINPINIVFNEYYFYLICEIKKNDKKFETPLRIDRIVDYKEGKERSDFNYGIFDDEKYRKKVQFMYTGEFKTIKFEFFGDSLEAVLDRLPTAKVIGKTERGVLVEAEVYGEGVKRWILSQKQFLKVVWPASYVDEIRETINEMYKLYN